MQLHHSIGEPDWQAIAPAKRNVRQRYAARSHGVVTPANIVTLVGLTVVLAGVYEFSQHRYTWGVLALVFGRLLDIVDGWLAQRTGTKGPLGELLDASADKVSTLLTVAAVGLSNIASWWWLGILLLPNILITVITAVLRQRRIKLHPSRSGKVSMALAWLSLIGLIALKIGHPAKPLMILVYGLVLLSAGLGLTAAYGYSRSTVKSAAL